MGYVRLIVQIHNTTGDPNNYRSDVEEVLTKHFDPDFASDVEVELDEYSTHRHIGPKRACAKCGCDLTHSIHERE